MFIRRTLDWLLGAVGISANDKTIKAWPPGLEPLDENIILVDFVKGEKKHVVGLDIIDADVATRGLKLQTIFSPEYHTRLNAMKRLSGADGREQVVSRAFAAYELLILLRAEGHDVGYYDEDGEWREFASEL